MPIVTINLANLLHNVGVVRKYAPQSKILAMVKANAYGHGLIPISETLAPIVDALGVARLEEAIILRDHGLTIPIVIMNGVCNLDEIKLASELYCDLVIHTMWQANLLQQIKLIRPVKVWLKINTGMNRLGVLPEEVVSAYNQLIYSANIIKPITFITHLSDADDEENPKTTRQLEQLNHIINGLEGHKSIANSGAIVALPDTHQDWVRPGIMLYGGSPLKRVSAAKLDLKPVMTLSSYLIAINQVLAGETIGYGSTWCCSEAISMGVIALGYGDGYPRHAESGTPVLINGRICPLVGRVSMDMITVDLTSIPDAQVGDAVILWGEGLPAELVAERASTVTYELFTHMVPRVKLIKYIK
ncbi:MAG: alanine racemase [Gammaproteobacteria bacterium RIFCSPHIGHO2_12_FULL_35_23]|nr:MAG: alanine racemase [Gammaproteobacteria bacterium RIFCSPHIGHO2_12_FULL_35_23]